MQGACHAGQLERLFLIACHLHSCRPLWMRDWRLVAPSISDYALRASGKVREREPGDMGVPEIKTHRGFSGAMLWRWHDGPDCAGAGVLDSRLRDVLEVKSDLFCLRFCGLCTCGFVWGCVCIYFAVEEDASRSGKASQASSFGMLPNLRGCCLLDCTHSCVVTHS